MTPSDALAVSSTTSKLQGRIAVLTTSQQIRQDGQIALYTERQSVPQGHVPLQVKERKKPLRPLQVGGVESFGEAAIDCGQPIARRARD